MDRRRPGGRERLHLVHVQVHASLQSLRVFLATGGYKWLLVLGVAHPAMGARVRNL